MIRRGGLSLTVKHLGRKLKHLPPSSAHAKSEWSTVLVTLMASWQRQTQLGLFDAHGQNWDEAWPNSGSCTSICYVCGFGNSCLESWNFAGSAPYSPSLPFSLMLIIIPPLLHTAPQAGVITTHPCHQPGTTQSHSKSQWGPPPQTSHITGPKFRSIHCTCSWLGTGTTTSTFEYY